MITLNTLIEACLVTAEILWMAFLICVAIILAFKIYDAPAVNWEVKDE